MPTTGACSRQYTDAVCWQVLICIYAKQFETVICAAKQTLNVDALQTKRFLAGNVCANRARGDATSCQITLPSHGRQRHWNIGGSQVERRRRENRGAVGG